MNQKDANVYHLSGLYLLVSLDPGIQPNYQQYFSYILSVSFIGGGIWNTQIQTRNVSGDRH
jgi:hypothetical protein